MAGTIFTHGADGVVWREARGAVYEVVAGIDSLQLHKEREILQNSALKLLQQRLDAKDPGVFSIQRVVQNQKKLEAKEAEIEVAKHDGQTVVIPANMQGFQVLLNKDGLRRSQVGAAPVR